MNNSHFQWVQDGADLNNLMWELTVSMISLTAGQSSKHFSAAMFLTETLGSIKQQIRDFPLFFGILLVHCFGCCHDGLNDEPPAHIRLRPRWRRMVC